MLHVYRKQILELHPLCGVVVGQHQLHHWPGAGGEEAMIEILMGGNLC